MNEKHIYGLMKVIEHQEIRLIKTINENLKLNFQINLIYDFEI